MMIGDDTTDGQNTRHRHIKIGLRKIVLGSLILYALCALGPEVIEYLTVRITTPVLLMLIVAIALATADVGSLMLILNGLAHLRKALSAKPASVMASVTDQSQSTTQGEER